MFLFSQYSQYFVFLKIFILKYPQNMNHNTLYKVKFYSFTLHTNNLIIRLDIGLEISFGVQNDIILLEIKNRE